VVRYRQRVEGALMTSPTPALDPKRTALLVMDFQHGVVARMPGLEPLLARVQRVIADVRDHGGTIAYVRVAFTEADWAAIRPPTRSSPGSVRTA
jgi:nicotinamidase-related amidase